MSSAIQPTLSATSVKAVNAGGASGARGMSMTDRYLVIASISRDMGHPLAERAYSAQAAFHMARFGALESAGEITHEHCLKPEDVFAVEIMLTLRTIQNAMRKNPSLREKISAAQANGSAARAYNQGRFGNLEGAKETMHRHNLTQEDVDATGIAVFLRSLKDVLNTTPALRATLEEMYPRLKLP